ncbi:hypothetical protein HDK77DRAFT_437862 [Phyllosticta capitalensis]
MMLIPSSLSLSLSLARSLSVLLCWRLAVFASAVPVCAVRLHVCTGLPSLHPALPFLRVRACGGSLLEVFPPPARGWMDGRTRIYSRVCLFG